MFGIDDLRNESLALTLERGLALESGLHPHCGPIESPATPTMVPACCSHFTQDPRSRSKRHRDLLRECRLRFSDNLPGNRARDTQESHSRQGCPRNLIRNRDFAAQESRSRQRLPRMLPGIALSLWTFSLLFTRRASPQDHPKTVTRRIATIRAVQQHADY